MTHNKSGFVWERINILVFVQFPWRFLSISIFTASLIGAFFVSTLKGKWLAITAIVICFAAVLLNWRYFRPEHFYYDATDSSKLSGQSFVDQKAGSVLDYLPKTALEPRELAPPLPLIMKGDAQVSNFVNLSNRWNFDVDSRSGVTLDVPVFDFPNWTTYIDGEVIDHQISFPSGRIEIQVPAGEHNVSGIFKNTPIRTFGNILSLISLAGVLIFIKYGKNTKLYT
jgi:hypothetical protein